MTKCVNCGKEHPYYVQDFLVVSLSSASDNLWGMTTTTERLSGAERHAICKVCLFKRVTKRSLLVAACVAVAVFFGVGLLFGSLFNRIGPLIFIAAVLGCAAGIAFELIGLVSRKQRAGHLRACVSAHDNPLTVKTYVPVGDGLYESEQAFKKVNSRFVTDIGARLYSELIATGRWKDYVAAAVSLADGQAAPIQTAETPEGEHKALLTESIGELLQLYRQTPGGFLTNSAAAQPVRAIGRKLDAAGGFELMLQAHGVFAASNPGMGLARNLEMVWDGIGGWRG